MVLGAVVSHLPEGGAAGRASGRGEPGGDVRRGRRRDQPDALQEFAAKYGVEGFTELADTDAAVWARFGVTRQPAYAFISPGGEVEVVKGSLSEAELSARVQALKNS